MTLMFPSVDWMQALADLANEDEGFKKFGRLDALVGFRVGEHAYSVNFEVLSCRDVNEASEEDLRQADFVITIDNSKTIMITLKPLCVKQSQIESLIKDIPELVSKITGNN